MRLYQEPKNEKPQVPLQATWQPKCVACMETAEIMFQGTSYCKPCLKERLRTGEI
jgi:hypothetical protein